MAEAPDQNQKDMDIYDYCEALILENMALMRQRAELMREREELCAVVDDLLEQTNALYRINDFHEEAIIRFILPPGEAIDSPTARQSHARYLNVCNYLSGANINRAGASNNAAGASSNPARASTTSFRGISTAVPPSSNTYDAGVRQYPNPSSSSNITSAAVSSMNTAVAVSKQPQYGNTHGVRGGHQFAASCPTAPLNPSSPPRAHQRSWSAATGEPQGHRRTQSRALAPVINPLANIGNAGVPHYSGPWDMLPGYPAPVPEEWPPWPWNGPDPNRMNPFAPYLGAYGPPHLPPIAGRFLESVYFPKLTDTPGSRQHVFGYQEEPDAKVSTTPPGDHASPSPSSSSSPGSATPTQPKKQNVHLVGKEPVQSPCGGLAYSGGVVYPGGVINSSSTRSQPPENPYHGPSQPLAFQHGPNPEALGERDVAMSRGPTVPFMKRPRDKGKGPVRWVNPPPSAPAAMATQDIHSDWRKVKDVVRFPPLSSYLHDSASSSSCAAANAPASAAASGPAPAAPASAKAKDTAKYQGRGHRMDKN